MDWVVPSSSSDSRPFLKTKTKNITLKIAYFLIYLILNDRVTTMLSFEFLSARLYLIEKVLLCFLFGLQTEDLMSKSTVCSQFMIAVVFCELIKSKNVVV